MIPMPEWRFLGQVPTVPPRHPTRRAIAAYAAQLCGVVFAVAVVTTVVARVLDLF